MLITTIALNAVTALLFAETVAKNRLATVSCFSFLGN